MAIKKILKKRFLFLKVYLLVSPPLIEFGLTVLVLYGGNVPVKTFPPWKSPPQNTAKTKKNPF